MSAYLRPSNLFDALQALSDTPYTVLAGATDIFPGAANASGWGRAGPGHPQNGPILDISGIGLDPESPDRRLREIVEFDDRVEIGALVRWCDVARSELGDWFEALRQAAREVGGRQIQNRATVAGNLCNASPAADGMPPLLALDARVRLQSASGERELPLLKFILGNRQICLDPSEVLTSIILSKPKASSRSAFAKLGARKYLVISIAMVAIWVELEAAGQSPENTIRDVRIAVGACSEVATRLDTLEEQLKGCPIDQISARIDAAHFVALEPIDDVRATADYRREVARFLVARTLAKVLSP